MYSLFFPRPIHITEAPSLNFLGAVVTCKVCRQGKDYDRCFCTQATVDHFGTCLNCLKAVALTVFEEDSDELRDYLYFVDFHDTCAYHGFELNRFSITASRSATPTGIASTGDPFSIFEAATPTPGATEAVTAQEPLLLPTTLAASTGKIGGTDGLSALRSLGAAAFGAVAAVAIVMGGLPL